MLMHWQKGHCAKSIEVTHDDYEMIYHMHFSKLKRMGWEGCDNFAELCMNLLRKDLAYWVQVNFNAQGFNRPSSTLPTCGPIWLLHHTRWCSWESVLPGDEADCHIFTVRKQYIVKTYILSRNTILPVWILVRKDFAKLQCPISALLRALSHAFTALWVAFPRTYGSALPTRLAPSLSSFVAHSHFHSGFDLVWDLSNCVWCPCGLCLGFQLSVLIKHCDHTCLLSPRILWCKSGFQT